MFNLNVIAISRSIDEDLAPPPTSPLSVVPSEKFAGVCLSLGLCTSVSVTSHTALSTACEPRLGP